MVNVRLFLAWATLLHSLSLFGTVKNMVDVLVITCVCVIHRQDTGGSK